MEPENSLPHSQVPATCPYPEPARSIPYSHTKLPEEQSCYFRKLSVRQRSILWACRTFSLSPSSSYTVRFLPVPANLSSSLCESWLVKVSSLLRCLEKNSVCVCHILECNTYTYKTVLDFCQECFLRQQESTVRGWQNNIKVGVT